MESASKCSVCNETSHSSSQCPCLYSPLKEGFYSGGGGGGGHSHDDDEHLGLCRDATLEEQVKRNTFEHLGLSRDAIYCYSFMIWQLICKSQSTSVQNISQPILTHALLQKHLA
jgi:hypothetical protein